MQEILTFKVLKRHMELKCIRIQNNQSHENIQFAGYLYDRLSFLTLALWGLFTQVDLMKFFPNTCSLLLWNHYILVFSMWVKPGPLCRTLGAADDTVVASLLLTFMIKICQQIAPEGVRMAGSAAQGSDWPQLGPLPMTEASLGMGQWNVCHCAAATGWRTQQCLAWPRHSICSPQRAVVQKWLKAQSEFNITVSIDLQLRSVRTLKL